MRAFSALPLDDDILDRIFVFLSDFDTLKTLILTSKAFHSVFQAHPNSIIRSVSYNLVGPALPQAIRYLRYKAKKDNENDSDDSATEDDDSEGEGDATTKPASKPSVEPESNIIKPIKRAEAALLTQNHDVVKKLEDFFSRKHKDRSFSSSVLTSMESWRFRRAMYRIMLFTELFRWSLYEDDYDEAGVEQILVQHRKFLDEFITPELQELYSVTLFLVELNERLFWGKDSGGDHPYSIMALSCGPAATLAALQDIPDNDFWDDIEESGGIPLEDDDRPSPVHDYLLRPLKKVLERRKATIRKPEDAEHWKNVLDVIVGEHDLCQKCSASPGGFNLRNCKNWDTLVDVFDKTDYGTGIRSLLKGNLSSNVGEYPTYNNLFIQPFDYPKFMDELFEFKRGTFEDWKKGDWLCETCIRNFITYHLHFWVLEKKKEGGTVIPEDCWYGYNCRTQTHSRHHAGVRNHFCEPTR